MLNEAEMELAEKLAKPLAMIFEEHQCPPRYAATLATLTATDSLVPLVIETLRDEDFRNRLLRNPPPSPTSQESES